VLKNLLSFYFLLREVLTEEEHVELSKEDEEKIKERLRALGYM